jgi:PAS domain S-box-containing protein
MNSSNYTDKPADQEPDQTSERQKLIGLGKRSISKSYYPELKTRLDELEQFRALLDRVNDAIFVVDPNTGKILDTSGSTHTLLNCGPTEIIGSLFKNILPQHIRRHADNLFNNETKTTRLETEFRCPGTNGSPSVPVEMTLQLVSLGDTRRAIIVARDISERKRNERALKQSHDLLEIRVQERTKELDQANKAKSEFISIVSHELRTPLTAVLGFTKIIRKKLIDSILPALAHAEGPRLQREAEQIMKNIDIITSEGNRLTSLIDNVLDLAKMEAQKVSYTLTPLQPEEFIQRSVDAISSLFDDTNLVLLLEMEPGLPKVMGDLDRLIQVMVNLFSNGVKFTSEGTVTCSARRVGDNVRISVSDTGIGIPADLLETIFEEFTQVGEDMSDRPRGTGLGLPICRHIIEKHGGHIWAESHIRTGSEFAFTLPAIEEETS